MPGTKQLRCVFGRFLAMASCFLVPFVVSGATHTWTGANSSSWLDNGNWIGGTPAGDPAANLVFPTASRLTSTNDIPGVTYVNSIQFTDSGYTINSLAGSSIALAGSIANSFSGTNTIDLPIALYGGIIHAVTNPGSSLGPSGDSTLVIPGVISGPASDGLNFQGGGTLHVTLSANNTYSGPTSVARPFSARYGAGALLTVLGSQPGSALNVTGELKGTGVVGPVDVSQPFTTSAPGTVSPGTSLPGILTIAGNAVFHNGGRLRVRLNGTNPGTQYDQLNVQGSAQFSFPLVELGYTPAVGDSFTILQATGGVTGGPPEGTIFSVNCLDFQIHYTSNSVVLTRVAGAGPPVDLVTIAAMGSQTVCTNGTGGTATVTDAGGCNNTNQWGYRTVSGGAITPIPGETATDYVIKGQDFPGVGTFYLVETTTPASGTSVTSNELTITVVPPPTAIASGSKIICQGASALISGTGASMCSWTPATGLRDPNSCSTIASPDTTTTYSLTVMGPNGCTSTNSAQTTVTVDPGCSEQSPTSFYTLPPCRIVDTRGPAGPFGGPALSAGDDRAFDLVGQCGVPGTARAVSLNVTVTEPTFPGYLTIHPTDTAQPLASMINFGTGQTRANNTIGFLGLDGGIELLCRGDVGAIGTVHLIIDVSGYFE